MGGEGKVDFLYVVNDLAHLIWFRPTEEMKKNLSPSRKLLYADYLTADPTKPQLGGQC